VRDNVFITARERGKIVARREGHNVFVTRGHQWLAELVSCTSFSPETPERNDRIRYMQFGIGGNMQTHPMADLPPLSTSYSVGKDPNLTPGHSYNKEYPIYPPISTLERPVRISGGTADYPGVGTDVWLVDKPKLFTTHPSLYDMAVHGLLSGPDGDVTYGVFGSMPLAEVGLLADSVGVGIDTAYSPIVAYYTFDTILMSPTMEIETIWTLKL
jgi:hypothetical protein